MGIGTRVLVTGSFATAPAFNQAGVTPQTVFRIASLSKPVLAVAVLSLVDSGILKLDAPVRDYVPGFFADMTLRQALNHTTGLADSGERRCAVGVGAIDTWLTAYAPNA